MAHAIDTFHFSVRSRTILPIPAVLDWNDDPSNVVGSEYIIMEHAKGIQLHQRWPNISAQDKINLINAISQLCKELTELEFPAYGSLYLKSSRIDTSSYLHLEDEFYIGPHCGTRFWRDGYGRSHPQYSSTPNPNRGPWRDLRAYADGLIDAGISRVPMTKAADQKLLRCHGDAGTHLQLLQSGRNVLRQIASDPRVKLASSPTLFHPDFHKRNIFVSENDPAVVTSIIDWQSASTEPAFWYTDRVPGFAQLREGDFDPASRLCAKAFEACFRYHVPRLDLPRSMDESFFRPFRYCHRTWKDGAVAFRHELIETARLWDELGFSNPCPYPLPSSEELANHLREYRFFEAAQNLRVDLARLIDADKDGWVPCDIWEEAKASEKQMFSGMLQAVLENEDDDPEEPIRSEADLREIWPFDL